MIPVEDNRKCIRELVAAEAAHFVLPPEWETRKCRAESISISLKAFVIYLQVMDRCVSTHGTGSQRSEACIDRSSALRLGQSGLP